MKQFLTNVTGMEGYLIFSMIIFLTFFIGLLWWVARVDKKYIQKMKNLPLEKNS